MIDIPAAWVMHRPVTSLRRPEKTTPFLVHHERRWRRVYEDAIGMYFLTLGERIYVTFDKSRFPK